MRRLILFRHAKSSWDDPARGDHDRPLNARGRQAAPLMGAWLAARGDAPDHVLSSTSARTLETWALARPHLPGAPEPVVSPRLYLAEPAAMLAELRGAPASARRVMMIGHQPGIGAFARLLADGATAPDCARAFEHFPTAAIAVIDLDAADWSGVDRATGRFHTFAAPREVAAAARG